MLSLKLSVDVGSRISLTSPVLQLDTCFWTVSRPIEAVFNPAWTVKWSCLVNIFRIWKGWHLKRKHHWFFLILLSPSVCLTVASICAAPLRISLRVGAALREFEHVGMAGIATCVYCRFLWKAWSHQNIDLGMCFWNIHDYTIIPSLQKKYNIVEQNQKRTQLNWDELCTPKRSILPIQGWL